VSGLRVAVPKGAIFADALVALERAGLPAGVLREDGRRFVYRAEDTHQTGSLRPHAGCRPRRRERPHGPRMLTVPAIYEQDAKVIGTTAYHVNEQPDAGLVSKTWPTSPTGDDLARLGREVGQP
jgi:hypothetical protein